MKTIKIIPKSKLIKKPNQKQTWNKIANLEKTPKTPPIIQKFLKNKKGKVIDLGCGDGRNMIVNKNLTYYGVDFAGQQLLQAEKHIKEKKINAVLIKSNINKLPPIFKKHMFHAGLMIGSLHCLTSKKQRKQALKELYRILKPNAEALISVWNSEDNRFNKVKGKNNQDTYMSYGTYFRYYYLFEKQELLELIKSTKFKIIKLYSPEKDRFSKKNWIIRIKK